MPELPEVETIRRFLEKAIVGEKIVEIKVLSKKQFPQEPKLVIGAKITGIERRGKNLFINLDNFKTLWVHLKMSGQLVWIPSTGNRKSLSHPIPFVGSELPAKSTRVVISLENGTLFFNEMRKFGWMKVLDTAKVKAETDKLGPEPFSADFTDEYLKKVFSKTAKPIKLVLLDQEKIAGIGNIYANEALFEAGIDPRRPAKGLNPEEIEKLRKAVILVLNEGIRYGGSSAADEAYIKPDATKGNYQEHFRVYQRNGEKCPKCGKIVERINLAGRGTFFCSGCQK